MSVIEAEISVEFAAAVAPEAQKMGGAWVHWPNLLKFGFRVPDFFIDAKPMPASDPCPIS